MIPVALTVAGSDPSGGAGIQTDLKTFARLNVHGLSAVTALTAQSTRDVYDVMTIPSDFVARQIAIVVADIPPLAMKTGMLGSIENVEAVAAAIWKHAIARVVVDPVLKSTSGAALLDPGAIGTFRRLLVSIATVVTPNLAEAAKLTGREVRNISEMEEAARALVGMGARHALVKGGHLDGDPLDVFFDGERMTHFRAARIQVKDPHGTGCVLSAAIAAYLALGLPVAEAVEKSKEFVTEAIRASLILGKGNPVCNPSGLR